MTDLTGFLGNAYPWVKAAHITFVIYWMAGLLLLPRFYVYHHETGAGSAEDRAWIERERRVRSIILTPGDDRRLAARAGAGLPPRRVRARAGSPPSWRWSSASPATRAGSAAYGRKLADGKRPADQRTLRIMNEIPGIAAAIIVVLVIVRPF